MDRRDILKYTAIATGAAISMPIAGTLLSGCQPGSGGNGNLSFFSGEEFTLIREIVDTLIPNTDSPSASDVGVHETIDHMVGIVYKNDDKTRYREGFDLLFNFFQNGESTINSILALEDNGADERVKPAYITLKQQTIAYYLNSEEVGKNFLNYLPVPGEYKPCITIAEADYKAWAI